MSTNLKKPAKVENFGSKKEDMSREKRTYGGPSVTVITCYLLC